MTCNINTLLTNGACFAAMPPFILQAIETQEWCDISGEVVPPGQGGSWWNPDLNTGIQNPDSGGPIVNPGI